MRIRLVVPDKDVSRDTIEPALETVTRVNQALLRRGIVPRFSSLVRKGKVRWKPEPAGHGEHFDAADVVSVRGWGDCDDLAPYWAAELRETRADPHARAVVRRSGDHRWHAVVRRGDGSIDDPSRAAGMGGGGGGTVRGEADRPIRAGSVFGETANWPGRGWLGRTDIPVSDYYGLAHYALAQDPRTAIAESAIAGACTAAVLGDAESCARSVGIARLAGGSKAEEISEEVGSLWGALGKAAKSVVSVPQRVVRTATEAIPAAALQSVPGLSSVPLVSDALRAAPALSAVLQSGLPLAQQLLPFAVPGAQLPLSAGLLLRLMGGA